MTLATKPTRLPERPWFSSGPTAKHPEFSLSNLSQAPLGRSNRSKATVGRLQHALELTRSILEIPENYRVFMMPGSDTGAFEAAMWNLLGERKTQILAFENFGKLWADDAVKHLKLDCEVLEAPYGQLPDLSKISKDCDIVFPWNGTTSGVRVPNADFIADDHEGLVLCDATSGAFSMSLPWEKLDVATFSFQKALGGEAGIGVLILSPKAVERLNSFEHNRPIPKIIRLKKGASADEVTLNGDAINTFSFLVIEDFIDALKWAGRQGGLEALIARTNDNFETLKNWVERTPWVDFVAEDVATRSTTSVCLKFVAPDIQAAPDGFASKLAATMSAILEREGAAYDINGYRAAPAGLRLWCGATVDSDDVADVLPWLEWAYAEALKTLMA